MKTEIVISKVINKLRHDTYRILSDELKQKPLNLSLKEQNEIWANIRFSLNLLESAFVSESSDDSSKE
jgi:hypothetical protein